MNSHDVGHHLYLLRAFVYVFRGDAEKTQVRQPPLLHAARISKFSLGAPHSAGAAVWPVSFLFRLSLCFTPLKT